MAPKYSELSDDEKKSFNQLPSSDSLLTLPSSKSSKDQTKESASTHPEEQRVRLSLAGPSRGHLEQEQYNGDIPPPPSPPGGQGVRLSVKENLNPNLSPVVKNENSRESFLKLLESKGQKKGKPFSQAQPSLSSNSSPSATPQPLLHQVTPQPSSRITPPSSSPRTSRHGKNNGQGRS